MVIVSRKLKPPSIDNPPLYSHPLLFLFLEPTLLAIFFGNIAPMKYRINTKINSSGKDISSSLEDYKTLHNFFICNTFICDTSLRFDPK